MTARLGAFSLGPSRIRPTFVDPDSLSRIDGQPALALEVTKRSGANIIETVEAVRAAVEEARADWPDSVRIDYLEDQSDQVKTILNDLEGR